MKVLVLGGDGFCGWPASLHLSARGDEVIIVDNFSRRRIDEELGVQSLTPIRTMVERRAAWQEVSGRAISVVELDVAHDYHGLLALLREECPDAIIHYAEQRAAPYSMKSGKHKRYTIDNNVNATHNVLCAIVESGQDIHLVHLGTMGVYGYGGGDGHAEGLNVRSRTRTTSSNRISTHEPRVDLSHDQVLDQTLFAYYAER